MAQDRAKSTRLKFSCGNFINQYPPDTIKSIRKLERTYAKMCRQNISISMTYALMKKCCKNAHTHTHTHTHTHIYIYIFIRSAFNKFPDFFEQAFKIENLMLFLYILWDDRPIFMISRSNEQLQKELEYILLKPDCHSWWISKMQSGREEKRSAIKFCFKLGKNAMRWKLDLLLWPRDQETEFLEEAYWLSQTQGSQTEQIYPQNFDYRFFFLTELAWSTYAGFPPDRQLTRNIMLRY